MLLGAICFFAFANIGTAQNSSLFHRPVSYLSQAVGMGSQGEALPAPSNTSPAGLQNNADALQSTLNLSPFGQPMVPANPFQGGYFPSPMENASNLGLQTSWSYVPPIPARALKLHDIVSIRIEETSTALATGNATSRKTTSYDATIKDWLRLVGLDTLKPAVQADGDPRLQTNQSEVYRGDSTLRSSESLTTNIAAEIVDIRPNGLIVLDASKTLVNNDNSWRISLTGTCRSQDIGPDNVLLSRNLLNSRIEKQDLGHVRDGYSRGWLTKLMARIKPF
ncbi:MAG: flagellar basal body L-ring protein FlgH [Planctomycetota bacterium]|nr:flagellar basal body L-ring protein FlgH [Planctomycetota bacterium]